MPVISSADHSATVVEVFFFPFQIFTIAHFHILQVLDRTKRVTNSSCANSVQKNTYLAINTSY